MNKYWQNDVEAYLTILSDLGVYVIVSLCMACGKSLGVKDGEREHGISHGLCPSCADEMKGRLK